MEKKEILMEMGFSKTYINALEEFEKATPTLQVSSYNLESLSYLDSLHDVHNLNLVTNNANYSSNLIVKM